MPEKPSAAILELIDRYVQSINYADAKLAASIWLTSPEATIIHPRGHERGWDQITLNFYELTMRIPFLRRDLIPRDIYIQMFGDAAIAQFYWRLDAILRDTGAPLKTEGRESQVFYKQAFGWRLVHVHCSTMPVTDVREGFDYGTIIH